VPCIWEREIAEPKPTRETVVPQRTFHGELKTNEGRWQKFIQSVAFDAGIANRALWLSKRPAAAYTLPMDGIPELTIVHDMDNYPAAARCSRCGEEMALRQKWITSSADNLLWFADQFRLHVAQEHER